MKKFLSALLSLTMLLALSLPAAALDQTAVDFVTEQGYMLGTGGGFEPDGAVTKAMACQVLYNMAGKPKAEGGFNDAEGQWYAPAAAWAKEAGLVSGDSFDGNAVLSGGELTGMLAAYAAKNGRVLPEGAAMYGDSVSRGELAKALYGQAPWSGGFTETKVSISANGRKITAVVTMPEGDGKFPAVVMNHGHGGSKDEGTGFAGIARALADKGIASIRMDFPGCGESPEPFTKNCLSNMVEDSNACRDYLVGNYSVDTGRLGVLGYSMGGRITSTIISQGEHGYQAVALLAGAVGDGEKMAAGAGGAVDPEQFPEVYAEAQEKGYYRITTPYGKVQDLAPQWFDDLRNIDPLENVGAFTGPVLVMYGDKDDVVPPEVNKLSLNAYPNAKEIVVPGANHGYAFYQTDPKVTAVVEDGIADFFAENLVSTGSSEKAGYSEKTVTFSVPEQDGVPAHEVVGTLTLPDGVDGAVPAVVMLHGTGSNRHEAGNGYDVAAPLLAKAGLASLRIDFMGAGDSKASDVDYSPTSANIDAKAAADYLAALEAVDGDAIGIMGWSQGGLNAMLAAAAYPDTFKAAVTWAGATDMKNSDFAQRHETAKKDGYTVTEYDWREPMRVGLRWYDDMAATDVLEKVAGYPGPILAIQGEADVIVVPETAGKIVEASTNSASKTHMIKDCDHTFNVFSGSFSAIEEAAGATAEYLLKHVQGHQEKEVSISVPEQDGIPAHEVPGTLTLPAKASGAPAVVMLHGTGTSRNESGNAFARLAQSLADAGIASLRIDFMGCGASTADNADFCPTSAIIDAKASANYLASLKEVDGKAIGVMGWSQGGMDALLSAAAHPDTFKAVVTWAGAISMDGAGIFGDVSFEDAYQTAKEKGEAIAPRWVGDPMHVGVRWFEEVQSMDTLAELAKYPGPILAVHGKNDDTVPPESAEQIVKASSNSASRTHLVENCEHTFNVFTDDTATMDGVIALTTEYFVEHLG